MNALASKPAIFSEPRVISGTPLPPSCLNFIAPNSVFFHVPFAERYTVLREEGLGTFARATPFRGVDSHATVCPDDPTDLNGPGKALQFELRGFGCSGRRITVLRPALSVCPFINAGESGQCKKQEQQNQVGFHVWISNCMRLSSANCSSINSSRPLTGLHINAIQRRQNRLLMPADKKSRGAVFPSTRDPALKSSCTF